MTFLKGIIASFPYSVRVIIYNLFNTASCGTDKGDGFPALCRKRNITQHIFLGIGIAKGYVSEFHLSLYTLLSFGKRTVVTGAFISI